MLDKKVMITAIAHYLKILGIVQLVGLNLGGFFWLCWAEGIRKKKNSSRNWVLAVHSLYLVLCGVVIYKLIAEPGMLKHIYFYGSKVNVPPFVVWGLVILIAIIYGLPVYWLLDRNMKKQFSSQNGGQPAIRDESK